MPHVTKKKIKDYLLHFNSQQKKGFLRCSDNSHSKTGTFSVKRNIEKSIDH